MPPTITLIQHNRHAGTVHVWVHNVPVFYLCANVRPSSIQTTEGQHCIYHCQRQNMQPEFFRLGQGWWEAFAWCVAKCCKPKILLSRRVSQLEYSNLYLIWGIGFKHYIPIGIQQFISYLGYRFQALYSNWNTAIYILFEVQVLSIIFEFGYISKLGYHLNTHTT